MHIAAITGSHILIASAHYVARGLRAWGWVMTILSAVQLVAAAGVWAGSQRARWLAVAVVGLTAIGQMLVIPRSSVLVRDDHRGRRRGAVGAMRPRQP